MPKFAKIASFFLFFAFFSEMMFMYSHYNNLFINNSSYGVKLSFILITIQVAKILSDIPIGIIADLYNRRIVLIIGMIAKATFCFICSLFITYKSFLIAAVFFGISMSAIYYHTEVYIYDTLKNLKKESVFASIISKYYATQNIAIAIASFASYYIISCCNTKAVFIFSGIMCLLSLCFVYYLPKTASVASYKKGDLIEKIKMILQTSKNITSKPLALRLITTSILLDTLFFIFLDLNTTIMSVNLLSPKDISIVIGIIGFIRVFANYFSGYTVRYFNFLRTHIFVFLILIVISFFTFKNSQYLTLIFGVYLCLYPFFDTSIKTRVQDKLESASRATVVSVVSIVLSISIIAINYIIGYIADKSNYYLSIFSVCMIGIIASEMIRNTAKIYKTYNRIKKIIHFCFR